MGNGSLPLDDDDKPALGLWDATGHQVVAAQAGAVSTDSVTGAKYATLSQPQPTSTTGTLTSVAAATSSTQLLALNAARKEMYVYNDSTAILYLAFAGAASTTSYTLQIPPGGFFEMPTSPTYTGAIFGIWSAVNGNARITEMS
jgi:hypothetical protein